MTTQASPGIRVIAHRGDSFHFPENTLASFLSAVEKQADLVELDAYPTKDGHLVVLHDSKLDRTTNAASVFGAAGFLVTETPFDRIKGLDAGSWKDPRFAGLRIPTLEEALQTIQKGSMTLLERKAGSALDYAKLLDRLGFSEAVVVQSFDWDFLAALRTWSPKVKLAALSGEPVTAERLADLRRAGIGIAAWNCEKVTAEAALLFREFGLEWWAWTVDTPEEWDRLAELGADGMITNKPGELREWLSHGR
jgi:glycerophosphoryl diester phosphodiesterase